MIERKRNSLALACLFLAWVGCDRPGPPVPIRPLEARLTGGYSHVECRPMAGAFSCRSDATGARGIGLDDSASAPSVSQPTRGDSLATLFEAPDADRLELVIRHLEREVGRRPSSAATWSDYGAVLWARHQAAGDGLDAFQALEATERALIIDPTLAEAQFNRALISTQLGLRSMALEAWGRAAERETDLDWAREIDDRRQSLAEDETADGRWLQLGDAHPTGLPETAAAQFPWRSRQQLIHQILPARAELDHGEVDDLRPLAAELAQRGDPLIRHALDAWPSSEQADLRQGIQELGRGLRLLEDLELAEATLAVDAARQALIEANHPLRWCAETAHAIARSYSDNAEAMTLTEGLLESGPPYPSVRARLHWLRGTLRARAGEMAGAASDYEAAARELHSSYGEHPAAYVEALIGEAASYDGRLAEAVDIFSRTLPRVSRHGDRRRLHAALTATGTALQTAGLHHAALRVYAEGLENARRWGEDYGLASSLRRWAIAVRITDPSLDLDTSLAEARSATAGIADPVLRDLTLGDLAVEEARLNVERSTVSNADRRRLGNALETFEALGSGFDVAQARLEASRVEAALDAWPEALDSLQPFDATGFRRAKARPVERPGALGTGLERRIELQRSRALFHAEHIEEALAAFERSRLAAVGLVPRDERVADRALELARDLDATFLLFQEGSPGLHYVVTPSGIRAAELAASSTEIRRLTAGFSALDAEPRRLRLERLGSLLLPEDWVPTRRLVVVSDPDFDGVPFAGLIHPLSRRSLVETTSTAHALHLHSLLDRRSDEPNLRPAGPPTALVVAAPDALPPSLPAASDEAILVANLVATGQAGSKPLLHPTAAEVAARLPSVQLFHFAGHARSRPLNPYRRELLLASGQSLDAERVLSLDLRGLRLAFISSCDSASMVKLELPGPGFADVLLTAGARQVVGTLWPVDDRGSLPLIQEFYSRLKEGELPVDALRAAQERMREEGDRSAHWMAYRLIGSVFDAESAVAGD